jgi:hypothetical protein
MGTEISGDKADAGQKMATHHHSDKVMNERFYCTSSYRSCKDTLQNQEIASCVNFSWKVYRVWVGKSEGKGTLERSRRRWEDGIRMDLSEIS